LFFIFFTSLFIHHMFYDVFYNNHFITFYEERDRKTVVVTRTKEKIHSCPPSSRPGTWISMKLHSVVGPP
jgi:hypothetical protein